MTETTAPKREIPMGGEVLAVVPQTFSDIQRVANQVIVAGIAPASLVKFPKAGDGDEDVRAIGLRNVAAVSSVLMAGAELGVPPMAALRMFTAINGRPALYADGNVAVVRKARDRDGKLICAYIRQGFERGDSDATTFAWCEAKRADNEEVHREEFSVEDAKRAGLWDDEAVVEREVWEFNKAAGKRQPTMKKVPNDAPWFRYPKRMMMWRATGYCLRWLFADVLGGMIDEFEAREIEGLIDITPAAPATGGMEPPEPPPISPKIEDQPEEDEAPEPPPETEASPDASQFPETATGDKSDAENPEPPQPTPDEFLANLEDWLSQAKDAEAIEMTWSEMDVESEFSSDPDRMAKALGLKEHHLARVGGQQSMFPGDSPMPKGKK